VGAADTWRKGTRRRHSRAASSLDEGEVEDIEEPYIL